MLEAAFYAQLEDHDGEDAFAEAVDGADGAAGAAAAGAGVSP
jgi:hypothetical protein